MMKKGIRRWLILLMLQTVAVTTFSQKVNRQQGLQMLSDNVFNLSEVMLHDATSPPAAARVYAYALLGAYEAAIIPGSGMPEIIKKFKVKPAIQNIPHPKNFNALFCASYTLLEVGSYLMPSGHLLHEKQQALIDYFKKAKRLTDREIVQQVRYSREVAGQVIAYARQDGYNKLSTYTRYSPQKGEGFWYPTPPAYMAAVEPEWETVRPFFLDSASQFAPKPPAPFSKDTTSSFCQQMREVFSIGKNLTEEQRQIASFWDCNPFAVSFSGHMAIGLKKISPGGHWMGITGIACRKANLSLDSAILVHTIVATTLHDAFISCWQEKFRSDRIRPETAINKDLDPEWRPLLQTPPFPEYSSGHSVASSSASVVLTYLLGDKFSFTDTSEIYFGLPERRFNSFNEAAGEAAISRLYGGIHFRDACEQGLAQGKQVGQFVLNTLFAYQP